MLSEIIRAFKNCLRQTRDPAGSLDIASADEKAAEIWLNDLYAGAT